jgi:glucose/arabinose dehydrogenase
MPRSGAILVAVVAVLIATSCGGNDDGSSPVPVPPGAATPPAVRLIDVVSGLANPVGMESLPDGRSFIIEQGGRIRILRGNVLDAQPFLDITALVESGGEKGLLGLAFHPSFSLNRRLFVNYTRRAAGQLQTVISEFTTSLIDPNLVDPASERILLTVDQPFDNHNGGQLGFGTDGLLYIALGDGGSGGDPQGNGQNTNVLLGKILRINVDSASPYGIPPDNPFAAGGGRPEVFAYGFRNPWRFSFDPPTSRLFVGDVGQAAREEIDLVTLGGNFGWNTMEGSICFNPSSGCNQTGLVLPIHDYGRSDGGTVIGGAVYRGTAIPGLVGFYVFGDFLSGRIWALRDNGTSWSRFDLLSTGRPISSFGRDSAGELFVLDYSGSLLRLAPQ